MIKSFRNEAGRAAWERRFIEGVPKEVLRIGHRKLLQLHNARSLNALRAASRRSRASEGGQHSMRINDQWRVCFVWGDGHAYDVEIVDYHA